MKLISWTKPQYNMNLAEAEPNEGILHNIYLTYIGYMYQRVTSFGSNVDMPTKTVGQCIGLMAEIVHY